MTENQLKENKESIDIEELSPEEKQELFKEEALPHLNALYNYAMSINSSREDAEDLVQDTFLRAYRFFHQYTPGTNCKAWLFTILRNLYNTRYKNYKKSPGKVHYDDYEEIYNFILDSEIAASIDDPEKELFDNILPEEMVEAINDLPEEFRSALILADIEEFSYKEIAEIMDCPIGTVMSRLHRARNILKKKLVDYAEERGIVTPEDREDD